MTDTFTPSTVRQFSERLNKILQSANKGQVLYRYRINGDEFMELQQYLTLVNALFYDKRSILAYKCSVDMIFVLYASEWWRRCYEGEWGWADIFKSIGIDYDNPDNKIDNTLLVDVVERGLKKWQRSISYNGNRRNALGSIAREGGLPIFYLNQTDGGWLERLLKPALSYKARTNDSRFYLESNQYLIPKSYDRVQIIDTLIELIDDIYELIQVYQLEHKDTPILYLNQNVVGWEDRFPFPLDAGPAQNMLRDLIIESTKQRRQVNSQKVAAQNDSWQAVLELKREINIRRHTKEDEASPSPTSSTEYSLSLSAILTKPISLSFSEQNFRLIHDNLIATFVNEEEENHLIGQWQGEVAYNQQKLNMRGANIHLDASLWSAGLVMQLRNTAGELVGFAEQDDGLRINPYQNASMYAVDIDVPFMAELRTVDSTGYSALYIGSYSQSTIEASAIIYLPANAKFDIANHSELLPLCPMATGQLYLLTGSVSVECDNNRYQLRTSAKQAAFSYQISGRQLTEFVYPSITIKGRIRVKRFTRTTGRDHDLNDETYDDEATIVKDSQILLKPLGTALPAKPLSSYKPSERVGSFRIQVIEATTENDESNEPIVVFQKNIGLVPETFKYRLLPATYDNKKHSSATGHLRLEDDFAFTLDLATPLTGIDIQAVDDGSNTYCLSAINAPVSKIQMALYSKDHASKPLRFLTYFPTSQVSIHTQDKNYGNKHSVTIDQELYGYRIKVFNSQRDRVGELHFTLNSRRSHPLIKPVSIKANQVLELSPSLWTDTIKKLLASSDEGLDDHVKVNFYLSSKSQFEMSFHYYEYQLKRLPELSLIQLTLNTDHLQSLRNSDESLVRLYDAVELKAVNLKQPQNSPITLPKVKGDNPQVWSVELLVPKTVRASDGGLYDSAEPATWLVYCQPKNEIDTLDSSVLDNDDNATGKLAIPAIRATVWQAKSQSAFATAADSNEVSDDSSQPDEVSNRIESVNRIENIDDLSFAQISEISNTPQYPQRRRHLIQQILEAMAFDPNHSQWSYLNSLTLECIDLPLVTLDNWHAAKQVPAFMCAVMVYNTHVLDAAVIEKVLREIGFIWEFIGIDDFSQIWQNYQNLTTYKLELVLNDPEIDSDTMLSGVFEKRGAWLRDRVSEAFTTLLSFSLVDQQSINDRMFAIIVNDGLELLIKNQDVNSVWWPEPLGLLECLQHIIGYMQNMGLSLDMIDGEFRSSYREPVILLPMVMAYLCCQQIDYSRANDNRALPLDQLAINLMDYDIEIQTVINFAPKWYRDTYHVAAHYFYKK